MDSGVITNILLGVLALVVGFVAYISANRAIKKQSEAALKAVDAEAFERARDIYESAIKQLRTDLNGVQNEVDRLRQSNEKLRESNYELRQSNIQLTEELRQLRRELHEDN